MTLLSDVKPLLYFLQNNVEICNWHSSSFSKFINVCNSCVKWQLSRRIGAKRLDENRSTFGCNFGLCGPAHLKTFINLVNLFREWTKIGKNGARRGKRWSLFPSFLHFPGGTSIKVFESGGKKFWISFVQVFYYELSRERENSWFFGELVSSVRSFFDDTTIKRDDVPWES